jgi:magnesium transporter
MGDGAGSTDEGGGPGPEGPSGAIATRAYRKGVLIAEDFPLEDVSEHLDEPDEVVWVDLVAPGKGDVHRLAAELGLHELAVEDALSPHQRPKVDFYSSHLFLSCHALTLDVAAAELSKTEVNAFVHQRWLVTVRKDTGFALDGVMARLERSSDRLAHGVAFLLYALLDEIIDRYFDCVSAFDDYYDDVSEGLFADTPLAPDEQRHWFRMRRALVQFHRLVVPMREAVSGLMRRDHAVVNEELHPYFQDVYDHMLRVVESTDALRDLVATIVETNLSLRDYRQNLVMKKVTSWAAIIAVPTLITGAYGMNVPYPGSGRTWGFVTSVVLIVTFSAALYGLFRRRDWL